MIDRAAKFGNLFHYATTQETVLVGCGKKNGFDFVPEGLIGMRHLEFLLEVGQYP
jgi:hypothetical protein